MTDNLKLQIKRVIKAKRQRVFDAWTKPELMQRWLAPGSMFVVSATADLKVGGSYSVEMGGDNETGKCVNAAVGGTYKKIVPNEFLSFTWGWPGDPTPETLVTVEFRDVRGGTEVILTHDGFASKEASDKHQQGWQGCFEKLEELCERPVSETPEADQAGDYTSLAPFQASRERVFDAITTPDGIRGWWTPIMSSSATIGGELRLEFEGLDEYIRLRIDRASRPSSLQWTCMEHTDLPEWAGTKMTFDLIERTPDSCELRFRYIGLTPKLNCYRHCEVGWSHFLASLVAYVEHGKGMPFTAAKPRQTTHAS